MTPEDIRLIAFTLGVSALAVFLSLPAGLALGWVLVAAFLLITLASVADI